MITATDARQAFFALFSSTNEAMAFQRKLLTSISIDALPECAKAVIENPDADRLPFYHWMVTEHSASVHDFRVRP
jgi:phosphatidylethanolamine-binding protein (PEBP) family uncharacterized protein